MQNAKNAFSTKEHAAVKYVTYLAIVQGTKNPCHIRRTPDAAGECLTQNISHDKWRSDSRRGLSYLPYREGIFFIFFCVLRKFFFNFIFLFWFLCCENTHFRRNRQAKEGKKWLGTDFWCAFFVYFMSEKGGNDTKNGNSVQESDDLWWLFLPFGFLRVEKWQCKRFEFFGTLWKRLFCSFCVNRWKYAI